MQKVNQAYANFPFFNQDQTSKTPTLVAAAGVLVLALSAVGSAQTATQTVTFQVDAINQISVTGAPALAITAAVAGSAPTSVTAVGSTWAVTTNQSTAKITASIASNMPVGLTLSANLVAPLEQRAPV